MSKLQPQRIEEIFVGSLASPKCPEPDIEVEGIVLIKVRFCRDRLGMHVDEIWAMLDELPESFNAATGGGMSFLNACYDRHGKMWTGEHRTMEKLFLLGMGIGAVLCPMSRDLWGALPGGVPYYTVLLRTS